MKNLIKVKKSHLYYAILILLVTTLFTTCKKYPENTLWFKNANNIAVVNGYITEYRVNGIDSLDALNIFYKPVMPNWPYPYNKTTRDIRQEYFHACCKEQNHWDINCDLLENAGYSMSKNKKQINIGGLADTNYFRKHIFITKVGNIDWDIQYLDKNGKKSRFKTTYNGNTYEITFEN